MNDCEHVWIANSGAGGAPVFRKAPHFSSQPVMHVRCERCGDRTWKTEQQWFERKLRHVDIVGIDHQRLTVGPYTITRHGDDYWIQHASGEGMHVVRAHFEGLIDEYYKREF